MDRNELYDLVWSTPMIHAAKRFGISDVALRKTCVRHDVPTPPLGYWAKLAHGKKVRQPALPALKPNVRDHIHLLARPQVEVPPTIVKAAEGAHAREAAATAKIVVPSERPNRLHPVALALERSLKKSASDSEGFLQASGPGLPNVKVGRNTMLRATILVDSLLKALLSRGYGVVEGEHGVQLHIDAEVFILTLSETRDRRPHVPDKADLKAQAEFDDRRRRYPTIYTEDKKAYRDWDYYPSGRLTFELKAPHSVRWQGHLAGRWYDRSTKTAESYLNDAVASTVIAAAEIKHERAAAAERARVAEEEAKRRQREAARRERATKRTKFLIDLADAFAAHGRTAALLRHFETQTLSGAELDQATESLVRELRTQVESEDRRFSLEALQAAASTLYGDDD